MEQTAEGRLKLKAIRPSRKLAAVCGILLVVIEATAASGGRSYLQGRFLEGADPTLAQTSAQKARQSTAPTWLFPSDEELMAAAQSGLNGGNLDYVKVYGRKLFGKGAGIGGCREITQNIWAAGPLEIAGLLGSHARLHFESAPPKETLGQLKGALFIKIYFLAAQQDAAAEAALDGQEGRLFRPMSTNVLNSELSGCSTDFVGMQPVTTDYRWEVEQKFIFQFDKDGPQPDWTKPVRLLIRRAHEHEEQYQLNVQRTLARTRAK